ncbi:LacI family DNA-binding transcriptional regulator [uncultured Alsobacter sp.]|uniref:LacI family DNA-binding transcriptional regulator n=1 Tax=uncultured Alsobacter sp. TaxID=1748258 RepID=UPI0025FEEBEE|nr:LacI family DNA-binding transcriptional regulator [uncultured Alsobacter sp.]
MGETRTGSGRPTTIVDIARAAGVSKSTVSLVLKGSSLVKPETKARVEDVIERFGYVYNRGAANLRTATSSFVGMVISDLTNPFFCELAVGIEEGLYQRGFVPILANTNEDTERQAQVLRSMREHGVGGIIMSPARGTDAWMLASLYSRTMPMVITMRQIIGSPLPYVGPDNQAGARKAVEHLIGLGHRRIGFLGGYATMTTQQERISGWRDAILGAGLPFDDTLVFESMPTRDGGRQAVEASLAHPARPTAVMCYNDIVAMGATRALAMRGLRAGKDMAVVGFDDIDEAEHNAPPLTTVSAETRLMGARCAESLLGLIQGSDPQEMGFTGPTRLVVRESCGAPVSIRQKELA